MKSRFILIAVTLLLLSCGRGNNYQLPTTAQIDKQIVAGNYTEAAKLIRLKLISDTLTESERWDLNFKLERMDRIRYDFRAQDTTVINYIKKYYPEVSKEEIESWEKSNALENMVIDGKK